MGQNPAVEQAVQQALSQALGTIERQLGEVQTSFEEVQKALGAAGRQESAERFVALLPPLVHMQAAGAALAASIETVLRFAGPSVQWTGIPAAGAPVLAPAPAPASSIEVEEVEAEEAKAAAPEGEEAAVAAPVEIETLPEELQQLHKRAARYARVAVQEFFLYKKDEVEKGRQNRDLYQRFKDEIDKSKAEYDKKFVKIAEHNIDYLYDELVRVLAENDPSVLGDYPHPRASGR